jgi:hypothetical protein
VAGEDDGMTEFTLWHQHGPGECRVAFAAWRGFGSPLRGAAARASCLTGTHAVSWTVQAETADAALALLPDYVARRTTAVEFREIRIP